jgi:LmbE family N-acetylglucosaminyl deacetylase
LATDHALVGALFVSFALGCRATPASDTKDPRASDASVVAAVARAIVDGGCERAAARDAAFVPASVPTWREPSGASPFDLVLYTAHPDDEAMYAGGTMARLARGGSRVAFVTLSHGEGGRLLERGPDGGVEERRDYPRSHVVAVRDREVADAARRVGVAHAALYPPEANVDDEYTTSCSETMAHWNAKLPGGVAGALERLVEDIRTRRPRVIITLDPRDDPQASHHGHHKAAGVLTDAAARLAADPRVRSAHEPHVVEEVLSAAPKDAHADVSVHVDVPVRLSMLDAYSSQFVREKLAADPIAQRPSDDFAVRWRAVNAPTAKQGTRLMELVERAP